MKGWEEGRATVFSPGAKDAAAASAVAVLQSFSLSPFLADDDE